MKVSIHNQTDLNIKPHIHIIRHIFKNIKAKHHMHIIFVTPEEIQRLNATFRKIDKKTDVLSFPNDDPDDDFIGDVFINLEQATLQAAAYEHSIEREVGFLAVHGYLHLIGYDHHTPEDEKRMTEEQERILDLAQLKRGN